MVTMPNSYTAIGTDVVDEITKLAPDILKKFPNAVFFGGQIVIPNESIFQDGSITILSLHHKRSYTQQCIPFVVLPIKV